MDLITNRFANKRYKLTRGGGDVMMMVLGETHNKYGHISPSTDGVSAIRKIGRNHGATRESTRLLTTVDNLFYCKKENIAYCEAGVYKVWTTKKYIIV